MYVNKLKALVKDAKDWEVYQTSIDNICFQCMPPKDTTEHTYRAFVQFGNSNHPKNRLYLTADKINVLGKVFGNTEVMTKLKALVKDLEKL